MLRPLEKALVNTSLILLIVILLLVYYWMQILDANFINIGDDNLYNGLKPVTFLYFISIILINYKISIFKFHFSIPSVLFMSFMGYFIYLGSLDHYFQDQTGVKFIYNESISESYFYIQLSLLSWIFGYVTGSAFFPKFSKVRLLNGWKVTVRRWSKTRLKWMVNWIGIVGIVAFSVFYTFYIKGFPVIQGISPNASSELRSIVSGEGHLAHLIAFNAMTMVLIYGGVYMVMFGKNNFIIFMFLSAILAFLLWGARIYIAIPVLMIFPYLTRIKEYPLKKIMSLIVAFVVLGSVYGAVRNLAFYEERNQIISYDNTIDKMASLHFAPEFRDTAGVVSYLEELRQEYGPEPYIAGIFYTALPGRILSFFGIDKQKLFDEEGSGSGWLIAKVTRGYDWGGVRPGIMSQTLMAFGIVGVIVLFVGYGTLFSYLDHKAMTGDRNSPNMVLIYILSGLFSFSIIGTTHSVFSKFWYLIYFFIIVLLLTSKVEKNKNAVL
jgi:oligosaccharide repeat unit polymerase